MIVHSCLDVIEERKKRLNWKKNYYKKTFL
jgi:hypothetical protein